MLRPGLPGSPSSLERRRRIGADDLTGNTAEVAEAMRQPALEIIRIARSEDLDLVADRDFDPAPGDDSAFFTGMAEHLGPGVGARRVHLVQDGHGPVADSGSYEIDRDISAAQVGQLLALVEEVIIPAVFAGEEVCQRHREYIEDLLERRDRRTDAVLLDLRDEAVRHASFLGQRTLGKTLLQAALLQPLADIDVQSRMRFHRTIISKQVRSRHSAASGIMFDFLNVHS